MKLSQKTAKIHIAGKSIRKPHVETKTLRTAYFKIKYKVQLVSSLVAKNEII